MPGARHSGQQERARDRVGQASMLHDIRNHLHGLNGVVQLMSNGVNRIGQHDAIQIAQGSLQLLARQLELLESAQRGQDSSVSVDEVDCHEFLASLCAMYTPLSEANGVRLQLEFDGPRVSVATDSLGLSRLLSNLILNAIRHSGATDVLVRARSGADGVVLLVQDNGSGLPELTEQWVGRLLAGAQVPSDYCRNGLLSCAEIARSGGIGLRLASSDDDGVCWQVSLVERAASPPPGDGLGPQERGAALLGAPLENGSKNLVNSRYAGPRLPND